MTAAFGARKYIELAVDLALSVRSVSSLPVSIVTSRERAMLIMDAYPGVFDRVIATAGLESVKGRARYVASKLQAIRNSPYRYTAFLDSDMVCATDPSYLLDTVEDDTFQVQGTHHTAATCGDKKHDETPISRLIEELGLESYVHCSLATFAFGSKGGMRVADLMESEQAYWAERTKPFGDILHDEILLGVMGSRTGVKFLEGAKPSFQRLDLSFRRTDDFSFIHVAPMRYREAIVVMSGVASRRMRSRVPVAPSLFWLSEILSRKAEQTGRSRNFARAVKSLAARLFDT